MDNLNEISNLLNKWKITLSNKKSIVETEVFTESKRISIYSNIEMNELFLNFHEGWNLGFNALKNQKLYYNYQDVEGVFVKNIKLEQNYISENTPFWIKINKDSDLLMAKQGDIKSKHKIISLDNNRTSFLILNKKKKLEKGWILFGLDEDCYYDDNDNIIMLIFEMTQNGYLKVTNKRFVSFKGYWILTRKSGTINLNYD